MRAGSKGQGGLRARADAIKARITVAELAELRRADPSEDGRTCDCPSCHGARTVQIAASGRTFACACGLRGDVITFEIAATGESFSRCCAALEQAFPARPDGRTADLFNRKDGT